MPLPETKPSPALLDALAEGVRYAEAFNKVREDVYPHIREWMTKSFPNAKIFDNRVHSLTNLVASLVYKAQSGKQP